MPGVAITAEACSTPGSFPSDAESCISDTESRYRFGSRRWMYTDLYTRVSFRRAARRRPARPSYTQNTLCLGPAAAFAARSVHPGAHRAPRQGPDLDRAPPRAELEARAAELERRSAAELPLYGIPFAIKDNIDSPGASHHRRLPEFAYRPEASAAVVERLVAAGAIPIGKTNLDQFATGLVGVRSPYGVPAQQLQSRLHPRRLELGFGGRGRGRARELQPRHRHRRLGARAGGVQQHRRPQAHARAAERARRGARVPLARLRLDLRPHRRATPPPCCA